MKNIKKLKLIFFIFPLATFARSCTSKCLNNFVLDDLSEEEEGEREKERIKWFRENFKELCEESFKNAEISQINADPRKEVEWIARSTFTPYSARLLLLQSMPLLLHSEKTKKELAVLEDFYKLWHCKQRVVSFKKNEFRAIFFFCGLIVAKIYSLIRSRVKKDESNK
jgi:hypothetical protein